MKKWYVILSIIVVIFLGGCQKTSEHFLTYQDVMISSESNSEQYLSETDFFAKDLVIIPLEENTKEDENIQAEAALLVDITDRKALYTKNVHQKMYPASLTKLATALVVLRKGELSDTVTIGYNATHIADPYAKVCGFQEGDRITLDALLHSMLIYSGNDASIAIAEHLAGSEEQFVKLMNDEVAAVGAVNSNFVNSHGLHDEDHYTTAYDIYLIFNELARFDTFRSIINSSSYTAHYTNKDGNTKEKTFETTNRYLRGDKDSPENVTVLGGKTGYTFMAGNCLTLLSESPSGNKFISILLKAAGEDNLYSEMTHLQSIYGN